MTRLNREELARAGRAVGERIAERGLSVAETARRAGVDEKTLRNLLGGVRWPHPAVRVRIAEALDWQAGEIYRRGKGPIGSLHGMGDRALLHELLWRAEQRGDHADAMVLADLLERARDRDPGNNERPPARVTHHRAGSLREHS